MVSLYLLHLQIPIVERTVKTRSFKTQAMFVLYYEYFDLCHLYITYYIKNICSLVFIR